MNSDSDLARRCSLAAHELHAQLPPATLLAAIHRRLERPAPARTRRAFGWTALGTAMAAAAIALVVFSVPPPASAPSTADAEGFVRLVSQDAWQRASADAGGTWLLETEVPLSRLAGLGLPYDPARAGERVPAQLLVHRSGDVLAVRFSK